MATLTIRNLDDLTKARLRVRAARRGHSMEEEARRILKRAVNEPAGKGLATAICREFQELAGVELELPPRSLPRAPILLGDDLA